MSSPLCGYRSHTAVASAVGFGDRTVEGGEVSGKGRGLSKVRCDARAGKASGE